MKHTPGPWTLEKIEIQNDGILVNVLAKNNNGDFFTVIGNLDATANDQNLIAAAPELLAIAREIADNKCDLLDSERRIRLYAAIMKAEGK